MVQIIDEYREPTLGERLTRGVTRGIGEAARGVPELLGKRQEKQAVSKLFGEDVANLNPELQKLYIGNQLKKKVEDKEKFAIGLQTLDEMQNILKEGHVGTTFGTGWLANPLRKYGDAGVDRSKFVQLGRSLIPLVAAGVPVRNQKEFEEYKQTITDPDATVAELQGAIDGLYEIFSQKLGSEENSLSEKRDESSLRKVKPGTPLDKETLMRIYKKTGGDKEKTRKVAKELGYDV